MKNICIYMKKTWTGINEIMNRNKRKSKPIVGLKRVNGNGVTRNTAELPNVLNDFISFLQLAKS